MEEKKATPEEAADHLYAVTQKVAMNAEDHNRCAVAFQMILHRFGVIDALEKAARKSPEKPARDELLKLPPKAKPKNRSRKK